jgi:hypothetical protein
MIKYETEKGVVCIEIDKHNRPLFKLPAGMHGDIWEVTREEIHAKLKIDRPNIVLSKKRTHA